MSWKLALTKPVTSTPRGSRNFHPSSLVARIWPSIVLAASSPMPMKIITWSRADRKCPIAILKASSTLAWILSRTRLDRFFRGLSNRFEDASQHGQGPSCVFVTHLLGKLPKAQWLLQSACDQSARRRLGEALEN